MRNSKFLFFILILTITFGCEKSLETEGLPLCLQTIIEEDRDSEYPIVRVSKQIVNDESFYLIIDELATIGETYPIFNIQCESDCSYCTECIQNECASNFPWEDWIVIWER